MEPAKDAFSRERLIILNKIVRKPSSSKGYLIKNFRKPTATIPKTAGFKEFDVVQRGTYNLHPSSLARKADRGKPDSKGTRKGKLKTNLKMFFSGIKRLT